MSSHRKRRIAYGPQPERIATGILSGRFAHFGCNSPNPIIAWRRLLRHDVLKLPEGRSGYGFAASCAHAARRSRLFRAIQTGHGCAAAVETHRSHGRGTVRSAAQSHARARAPRHALG
eukprot:scaffold1231_cov187-Pinguiococcus_pyrenoidosus.AAC.15